ncbi:MAG: hypothetical protein RIB45_10715 [Marivibrio sp.]|uniref:hypothetical protein n=1 Tax=Marivibrio sp. TaxID=2039719 RepID=UPI0032F00143
MSGYVTHLLARLPEYESRIKEALETVSGFEAVARAHHEVCDELSAGVDEPGELERLHQRRKNLEEEIVRTLEAGGRV